LFAAYLHLIALCCRKRGGFIQPGDHSAISSDCSGYHSGCDTSDCRHQTTNW